MNGGRAARQVAPRRVGPARRCGRRSPVLCRSKLEVPQRRPPFDRVQRRSPRRSPPTAALPSKHTACKDGLFHACPIPHASALWTLALARGPVRRSACCRANVLARAQVPAVIRR